MTHTRTHIRVYLRTDKIINGAYTQQTSNGNPFLSGTGDKRQATRNGSEKTTLTFTDTTMFYQFTENKE